MSLPKDTVTETWLKANHDYLMKAIARIQTFLEPKITQEVSAEISEITALEKSNLSPPSTLEKLCQIFNLSSSERDILLLCAAIEFDGSLANLYAAANGNPQMTYPTFYLAKDILSETNWDAIAPMSPLRQWQMIEVGSGNSFTSSPLRIDERILHYLMGIRHLDRRLFELVEPLSIQENLVSSHEQIVQQIVEIWSKSPSSKLPILQLCGEDISNKRAIACAACHNLQLNLYAISAEKIPTETNHLQKFTRLWKREYALNSIVLLLECQNLDTVDANQERAISQFIESINYPLIVSSYERRRRRLRPFITFDIYNPTAGEQRLIWQNNLDQIYEINEITPNLDREIENLVSQFNLTAPAIQAACLKAKTLKIGTQEKSSIQNQLWNICRIQARPRLDELAQQIESSFSWDDLVLPEKEMNIVRQISVHVRQRTKVYQNWALGSKSGRGNGIAAMFAGASGTGKTMAADVLGNDLNLDVYRIDLSSLVSKYIGETEKNLRRVFDAAEAGGVILLFDEADSLFGKRSDVKSSNDHYANLQVGYLLQRMESYRGLAILTTNLKNSIDQAFLRRIRFVVEFPFPSRKQRAEIWRRVFPKQTPTEGLDFKKLGQLTVAGGNIRNIALNAAFLAADADEPIQMKHILQAAKAEYVKLERQLTDIETKGWR
ncbi:MAG: ATP-binding protein [Cyanobacteria bacterium J06633_8]